MASYEYVRDCMRSSGPSSEVGRYEQLSDEIAIEVNVDTGPLMSCSGHGHPCDVIFLRRVRGKGETGRRWYSLVSGL